jgi:hypothetical protein
VRTHADLRRLEEMDTIHYGLNGRQIAYRQGMIAVAEKYPVVFWTARLLSRRQPGADAHLNGPFSAPPT